MAYLIGHLVGDFLLQTGWMAAQKKTHWMPLLAHAAVYTLAIALATGWGAMLLAIVFATHVLLDGCDLARLYNIWIKGDASPGWLVIVTDQALHLFALYVIDRLPGRLAISSPMWAVVLAVVVIVMLPAVTLRHAK